MRRLIHVAIVSVMPTTIAALIQVTTSKITTTTGSFQQVVASIVVSLLLPYKRIEIADSAEPIAADAVPEHVLHAVLPQQPDHDQQTHVVRKVAVKSHVRNAG